MTANRYAVYTVNSQFIVPSGEALIWAILNNLDHPSLVFHLDSGNPMPLLPDEVRLYRHFGR